MKTAQQWIDEYGESHQNPTNKLIHWVCVPAILFASVGLLWAIPMAAFRGVLPGALEPLLNWGSIGIVLCLVFYATMGPVMFIGMAVVGLITGWGCAALADLDVVPFWVLCAGIWLVAWVFQFIGHKIEGKKPSFLQDVQFLLVGPAWLLHFIYLKLGIPISNQSS